MIDKKYLNKKITDLDFKISGAAESKKYSDAFAYSCMKRVLQDIIIDAD